MQSPVETLADGDLDVRSSSDAPLTSGTRVGRYIVLARVGAGGMGVVYGAYDPELDRKVAIKVLRQRRSAGDSEGIERLRMLREAQALARLAHPNVVAVHDAGLVDDRVFVAMDFVEGADLRTWVKTERPSWRAIVDAYVQAARGLAAAHAAGLVHRDFKPDNAIRDASGRVQVLDFGLARASGNTGPQRAVSERDLDAMLRRVSSGDRLLSLDTPVTNVGARIGTPAYMAPEQHVGGPTDAATDQFALCVALYEALYDTLPFRGDTVAAIALAAFETWIAPPPKGSRVPSWVRKVIVRGLACDPNERWPSLDELVAQLQRDPEVGRRRIGLGIGVVALAAAGIALSAWHRTNVEAPCRAAAERMHAVWGPAQRETLRLRFAETGRPYARDAAAFAIEAIDARADAWTSMHTDACEATHIRGEQSEELLDLRMSCLDRRLRAMDALVDRMLAADGEVVDRTRSAVATLEDLAACSDPEGLRAAARTAVTADPRALAALERNLADIAAAIATGKAAEVRALAADATQAADVIGDPFLQAIARYRHGEVLEMLGDYHEAERVLVQAAIDAEAIDAPLLLGQIRRLLVLVVGDRLAAFEQGHLWERLAQAAYRRAGAGPAVFATLANTHAYVYVREGKPSEALAERRWALALLDDDEHADPLLVATIEADLAYALADAKVPAEAATRAEHALATYTRLLGPEHPKTAQGHAAMAAVLESQGRYREALQHYEHASAIVDATLGPDVALNTGIRTNAAIAAITLGDLERGEREFRRVLEAEIATYGDEHVQVASAMGNLASLLRMRERYEEAEDLARRALAMRERLLPPDHPNIGSSLATLANVLEFSGQHDDLLALRERVLAIEERTHGLDSPNIVVELGNLAYSAMLVGEPARALAAAERGLVIAKRHDLVAGPGAFARVVLARVLSQRSRGNARVRELVQEALPLIEGLGAEAERRLIAEIGQREGWRDGLPPVR